MTRCGASASWRKNSLSAGISPIVVQARPAREDVEAVEADAERGVIGRLHEPPGVVVLADVAAPRERLVGDAEPARRGPLGEQPQLLGGERVVVDRVGRDVRADEDLVGPEVLHHVELRLRPAQVALELIGRHRLEVAERLVEVDGEAEVVGQLADLGGDSGEPMRSFSKISTPSKPAREAAFSFSSSVPLRHTVAIPLRTRDLGFADQRREVAQHALAVGLAAGEQGEGAARPGRRPCRRRRACGSRAAGRAGAARSRAAGRRRPPPTATRAGGRARRRRRRGPACRPAWR